MEGSIPIGILGEGVAMDKNWRLFRKRFVSYVRRSKKNRTKALRWGPPPILPATPSQPYPLLLLTLLLHKKNFPSHERGGEKVVRRRSFLAAIFGDGWRHTHNDDVGGGGDDDPPRRSTSRLSSIVRRKRRPDADGAVESPQPPLDEAPNSPEGSSASSWWFPFPSPARQVGSTAAGTLAWAPAVTGSRNRRRQRERHALSPPLDSSARSHYLIPSARPLSPPLCESGDALHIHPNPWRRSLSSVAPLPPLHAGRLSPHRRRPRHSPTGAPLRAPPQPVTPLNVPRPFPPSSGSGDGALPPVSGGDGGSGALPSRQAAMVAPLLLPTAGSFSPRQAVAAAPLSRQIRWADGEVARSSALRPLEAAMVTMVRMSVVGCCGGGGDGARPVSPAASTPSTSGGLP
uniref:Uncharacterized protein n=1 Tax=Oryza glumipatula TaxID=40148 RepID=A0A0E0B176_9ORYZ